MERTSVFKNGTRPTDSAPVERISDADHAELKRVLDIRDQTQRQAEAAHAAFRDAAAVAHYVTRRISERYAIGDGDSVDDDGRIVRAASEA